MIDYIKILITDINLEQLKNSNDLTFNESSSMIKGKRVSKRVAKYHHCKIIIYDSGTVMFSGSIHKLYNSLYKIVAPNYKKTVKQQKYKGYNGTQFTLANILEVRTHLTKLFKCEPQQMKFQNIEFGINSQPDINPQIFIKGLLYQRGKKFEFKYSNCYAQVKHQKYILKIYNKSNQYGMSKHTLRIEIKGQRATAFLETGIKTFADINTNTIENAKQLLLKRFDEVVYYDYTISKKELTNRQKQDLVKYSNPRFWFVDLIPNRRSRHKERLRNYIVNYSTNLHQKIRTDIIEKCSILNRCSED